MWKRGKGGHSGCMTQPLEAINTPIGTRTGDLLYSSLHTFPFHPKPSSVGIYTKQSSGWHPRTETPFINLSTDFCPTYTDKAQDWRLLKFQFWQIFSPNFFPLSTVGFPTAVFQQRGFCLSILAGQAEVTLSPCCQLPWGKAEPQGIGGGGGGRRWDTRLTSSDPLALATLHVVVHSHWKSVHVGLAVWHLTNYRKSNNHDSVH